MKIPDFIGKTDHGVEIELPEDAITLGFADFGRRGMGKSNLLATMLETFKKRKQSFVALDPPDAHWGIRFAVDASGRPSGPSGLDILLVGGDHGDVPLDPDSGKELAHIIVDGDISAVICMRALNYTQQQRFCADFGEELFRINRTPRCIAFEEAHNFLPQQLKFDEQKRVLYAMQKIISEGRGSGLGYVLASQRPSVVNKDALEEVDAFFALGMIGPNDLKQVENWFKHHVKRDRDRLDFILEDIASMDKGDVWYLNPQAKPPLVKFHARIRSTYHSGRTPKPGERPVNFDRLTVPDAVAKLKELFKTRQSARLAEISDLKQAKKRIQELEGLLKKKPVEFPQADLEARVKIICDRYAGEIAKKHEKDLGELHKFIAKQSLQLGEIIRIAQSAREVRAPEFPVAAVALPKIANIEARRVTMKRDDFKHKLKDGEIMIHHGNGDVSTGQMNILKALLMLQATGQHTPSREAVAVCAGASPTSSTFGMNLGALLDLGFVRYPTKGSVELTPNIHALPIQSEVFDRDTVRENALKLLKPGERRAFEAIYEAYPRAMARPEIAEAAKQSVTSSTFGIGLSKLNKIGLVNYVADGIKAADWLF